MEIAISIPLALRLQAYSNTETEKSVIGKPGFNFVV